MRRVAVIPVTLACCAGCGGPEPEAVPTVATAQQETFDLPATVAQLEAALSRQRMIADRYPVYSGSGPRPVLDPADHAPLWQAAQDELAALETIVRMSDAHPDWDATIAKWYDASIGPPLKNTAKMFRRRGNLVGEAAGSEESYQDYFVRRGKAVQRLLMIKTKTMYPGLSD